MKIGIICAGDSEFEPFVSMLNEYSITEKVLLKFYEGKIGNKEIVALFSGVGKVNSAIATQILIDTYKCNIIINAGTAGGISEEIELFDTIISTEVAYHDIEKDILTDFHPYLPSIYFASNKELIKLARKTANQLVANHRIFFGRMVTGEKFITNENRNRIKNEFFPLSVDMESAAIAHVCYVNSISFIAIRTITDNFSHEGVDNFEMNCCRASKISANFIKEMLKNL